jgi:MFS family permease
MTFGFLAMAAASIVWGSLSDRFGPRPIVLAGSVMLALSLARASRAETLGEFQLIFGLLVGIATAAVFAPMMACVTGWFETRRSLAVSVVSAGMGMAPLTMAPLTAWLVTLHDWRSAMLIIAGIAASLMIPAACLVRSPPAMHKGSNEMLADALQADMSVQQAVRSPQFFTLMLANFFCCATHSGPIFHTVSYAVTCGIPMISAVSIYSVEGLAGMFGRIGFGLAGDRFGAQRVLVMGLLAQAFGVLAYVFISTLAPFYAVAALVGFIYAGTMPLYAVIIRENFPMKMMGTIIGGTAMAGSLGMSTGPLLGGLAYDRFDSYVLMYIGSSGMGLAAVLILMTFRPFPSRQSTMAAI